MWITRVKIGELHKKIVVMVTLISVVAVNVGIRYVVVMNIGVYGVSSVVALGVYGWIILGAGMTLLLLLYLVGNCMVELNWKLLALRVLPLPAFFIKVSRS